MQLKTMPWNEDIWQAFLRAAAYIPPPVRMEAVTLVVEQSEARARARGSERVEEPDLMASAAEKVPRAYRRVSLQVLQEQGLKLPEERR